MKGFINTKGEIVLSSIIVSFLFLLTFAFSINPFLLNTGGDSAVYQQVGQAIVLGKIPYVDLFEGKGFLMFLFQAIGLFISDGHWGLLLISVLNLSVCVYFWFKTSRLYLTKKQSWIPVLFVLLLMGLSYTNSKGNGTEFWSMPYISYALYVIARYYKTDELVNYCDCFIIGLGMGVITFIRMNNMAPICMVCLALLVDYIRRKEYKGLGFSILWVFVGFVSSCLFTILLFWIMYGTENIYSLFYGTFLYNFSYFGGFGNGTIIQYPFFISIIITVLFVLSGWEEHKRELLFVLSTFGFCYLTMGKAFFIHYFEISYPLYIIALSIIINSSFYSRIPFKRAILVVGVVFSVIAGYAFRSQIQQRFKNSEVMEDGLKDIRAKLLELPEADRDSIWNCNAGMDGCIIMQTINRVPMNRLNKKIPFNTELTDIGTIQEIEPLYIMTKDNYIKDKEDMQDSTYIRHNYDEIFRTKMVMDGVSHVVFYKRK